MQYGGGIIWVSRVAVQVWQKKMSGFEIDDFYFLSEQ